MGPGCCLGGKNLNEEIHTVAGAQSTKLEGRFDLICPAALRRLAKRWAKGSLKYDDYNWCRGQGSKYYQERLNHLIQHVVHLLEHGDDGEDDDIGGILANASMLAHFLDNCKCHEAQKRDHEKLDKRIS